MERKEDATFICCGTDNEKNISDASPQKKQMSEVTLIKLPDIETESLVGTKTGTLIYSLTIFSFSTWMNLGN